jgi:hypothetical protein
MRLTNYIRDAFLSAVMADVPQPVDYSEEIRKTATEDIMSTIPESVKVVWNDLKAREYLKKCYSNYDNVSIAHPGESEYRHSIKLTAEAKSKVDKLIEEMNAERKKRHELRKKLEGVAYGCKTLKQLRDLLPEFTKYMPEEDKPLSSNLPAITNVVADFVKAGWPKDKKNGN